MPAIKLARGNEVRATEETRRFAPTLLATIAILLVSGPAPAQNAGCAMRCNGMDNTCYSTCAGPNYSPAPGGGYAPGGGRGRSGGGYGAIAVSERVGDRLAWGKAFGYASSAAAKAKAMRFCASSGLPGCKARVWFSNACAALITTSDGAWWTSWRNSLAAARRFSLDECMQAGKGPCTVKEAFCSR